MMMKQQKGKQTRAPLVLHATVLALLATVAMGGGGNLRGSAARRRLFDLGYGGGDDCDLTYGTGGMGGVDDCSRRHRHLSEAGVPLLESGKEPYARRKLETGATKREGELETDARDRALK